MASYNQEKAETEVVVEKGNVFMMDIERPQDAAEWGEVDGEEQVLLPAAPCRAF